MKHQLEAPVWKCKSCGKNTVEKGDAIVKNCGRCGGRHFFFRGATKVDDGADLPDIYMTPSPGLLLTLCSSFWILFFMAVC